MEDGTTRIYLPTPLCSHLQDIAPHRLRLSLPLGTFACLLVKRIEQSSFHEIPVVPLFLQIWLPRVFQSLLAALADVKFFFLVRSLESGDTATWTVRSLAVNCVIYCESSPSLPRALLSSPVLLPSVLMVLVVLLHQDTDQQHGDHPHLSGSVLLPPH